MGAPIRSQTEIDLIVNKAQHAIGDIGYDLVGDMKRGESNATSKDFRDSMYKLLTLRAMLRNILNDDGDINAYYSDSDNEKKFNKILDGLARMALVYTGTAIPLLTGKRIPLYYYPTSNNPVIGGGGSGNFARFENDDVDSPGEVVDSFDANTSQYALYVVTVIGSGGSRTSILVVTIRSGSADLFELKGQDIGTSTDDLTFSAALNGSTLELTADAASNNWVVKGVRIY